MSEAVSTVPLQSDSDALSVPNPPGNSSKSSTEWDFTLKLSLGSDCDDQSDDAGKSTSSSHRFSSPNPSEQDNQDTHDKKVKRRRIDNSFSAEETTPKSSRQQHFPLSERQQLALVMQQTLGESARSPSHHQTPSSSGGKPRGKQPKIYRRNDKGESLLHVASKRGDKRGAKSLIRQGADVNAVDYAGWTPLHESCNHGFYETAKLLIKHGANVNVCGLEKDTPLHDAAISGNVKLVLLLLKNGALVDSLNSEGQTPLGVATDPDVIRLLSNKDDLNAQLATLVNSPSSSSASGSDDDFETDVNSTPKSFCSPLPSPPQIVDIGVEGKTKLHSPKMSGTNVSAKADVERVKSDETFSSEDADKTLTALEVEDISPAVSQEKVPVSIRTVEPPNSSSVSAETISHLETPKSYVKREPKKAQQQEPPATVVEESRRSGRPPRASFKARMDSAVGQLEKPKAEGRGRRTQKSKKRKSEHDVYEFHSSDSDEERMPVGSNKFGVGPFHDNSSSASSNASATPKVTPPITPTATAGQKKLMTTTATEPPAKPKSDDKPSKEESFPPPKTAFEIAISESFGAANRPYQSVSGTGRGRGKHQRFGKPKRKNVADPTPGKLEDNRGLEKPIDDCKTTSKQDVEEPQTLVEDSHTVREIHSVSIPAAEPMSAAHTVDSIAHLSPSMSEAQKEKDDAEVAAISSNVGASGDRSDSDTPSSSQSDASLKVPPLRIVFPTTSRSNSAVSEADAVSNHSVAVGVTVSSSGRLPYVVKLKDDANGGVTQDSVEGGRSLETSEASDDESGSAAQTNDGTQSETEQPRPLQEGTTVAAKKGAGGHTKRVTRSQARRGGHQADGKVKEMSAATVDSAEVSQSGSASEVEKPTLTAATHVHPRKRKYHRREIHPAVAPPTEAPTQWTSTVGSMPTSETTRTAELSEPSPSTSSLPANDLTSISSYEGFRELRTRVENKWQLHTEPITYERPVNFEKFWMNTKEYLLEGHPERCTSELCKPPPLICEAAERLFNTQESARHSLRIQHQVERERLRITCEKEVIRAYNRHSRVQAGQSAVPFSFARVLHDAEIYNPLELEKSTHPPHPALSEPHPHLHHPHHHHHQHPGDKPLSSWVEEVMERFRKRKTNVIAQHRMECDSLTAVQRMEWDGMLKRLKAAGVTRLPQQFDAYVPAVEIVGDFNLLPL